MKILYNSETNVYCIDLEYPEIETYIKADNIAEVRETFINRMAWLFDTTLREYLKDSF